MNAGVVAACANHPLIIEVRYGARVPFFYLLIHEPSSAMGLRESLFKQFGKPSGLIGEFVGWIMSYNNKERAYWTVEKLECQPSDYLLEIGYGPGVAIRLIAERLTTGFIAGIDHSPVMWEQASIRNHKYIERSRVKLECGTIWDLNYPDNYFDIVYGSNVHFFWEEPVKEFQQLYRLLKPAGKLVMVFQPRWTRSLQEIQRVADLTRKQFEQAGLRNVSIDYKPMRPMACLYVGGHK